MHAVTDSTSSDAVRFRRLLHRRDATPADLRFMLEALRHLPFSDLLRAMDVHEDLGDPDALLELLYEKFPRGMDVVDAKMGAGWRVILGPPAHVVAAFLDRVGPELDRNTLRLLREDLAKRVARIASGSPAPVEEPRRVVRTTAPCDDCLARARKAEDGSLREVLECKRPTPANESALYELVRGRFMESPTCAVACVLGELLTSANGWEKRGPELVRHAMARKMARSIMAMVAGDLYVLRGTFEARLTDYRVLGSIHLAIARGLIAWAGDCRRVGDEAGVIAALRAIALLDPPRHFVRELSGFRRLGGHSKEALEWLDLVDGYAREGAGEEVCMVAIQDAVTNLGVERGAFE